MPQYGYMYILASKGKRLYVGITTHLEHRVWQHKTKADPHCFTANTTSISLSILNGIHS